MNLNNENAHHLGSGTGSSGFGQNSYEKNMEHGSSNNSGSLRSDVNGDKTSGNFYPSNHQMQTNSIVGANSNSLGSKNNNKSKDYESSSDKAAKNLDQKVSPKTSSINPPGQSGKPNVLGADGSLRSDPFSTPKIPFPPLKDSDAAGNPASHLLDGGNSLLDILGPNNSHSRASAKEQKLKHNLASISKNKESARDSENDADMTTKQSNNSTAKKTPRKIIKKPPRKYSGMNEIHNIKKVDVISRIKPNNPEKKQEMSETEKHKEASNRIDYTDQPKWSGRFINNIFKGLSRDNSRTDSMVAPNNGLGQSGVSQSQVERSCEKVTSSHKKSQRSDYSKKGTIDVDGESGVEESDHEPVVLKKKKRSKKDKDKKKHSRSRSRSRDREEKKKKKGDDSKKRKDKKEKKKKEKY